MERTRTVLSTETPHHINSSLSLLFAAGKQDFKYKGGVRIVGATY
jgi:hypothetical protein